MVLAAAGLVVLLAVAVLAVLVAAVLAVVDLVAVDLVAVELVAVELAHRGAAGVAQAADRLLALQAVGVPTGASA